MIPVIGVLHLTDPIITENMLRTVPDDMYERLVIVDNSAAKDAPTWKPRSLVMNLGCNMGVAHGWNTIIKATPEARWWAIFNNDVELARSDLERLEAAMHDHDLVKLGGYEAFGISHACIKRVGWFDENFHPAYCEDNDYQWRATQLQVPMQWLDPPMKHLGSYAITAHPELRAHNDRTYPKNVEFYHAKWGGHMGSENYHTPYNMGGSSAMLEPDIDRLVTQRWPQP